MTRAGLAVVLVLGAAVDLAAAPPALADPPLLSPGAQDAPPAEPTAEPADQPWSVGVSAERRARASELLARGNELLVENRFAAALEQYRLAVAAWDHPAIRANMVVCLVNLGRPLEAYENVLLALRHGAAPHVKPEVYTATLAYRRLLAGQIGRVRVHCREPETRVTLDGRDLLTCPLRVDHRLLVGRHQLVARRPGFLTVTRDLVVTPGSVEVVDLRMVRLADAAITRTPWPTWKPWALTGAGLGLVAVGGAFELLARSDLRAYEQGLDDACPDQGCAPEEVGSDLARLERRAERENRIAIAALSTGGAVAVAGLIWVYLNREQTILPEGLALGVGPVGGPDAAGVLLGGRF